MANRRRDAAKERRWRDTKSRQELLDFLERWAETVDWNAPEGSMKGDDRPMAIVAAVDEGKPKQPEKPRPAVGRFAPRKKYSRLSAEEAFFLQRLRDAKDQLDEMEQVLEALGGKLDAAKMDEEVDVDSEVDAIEKLIWRHNDALESARDAWLRDDLSREAIGPGKGGPGKGCQEPYRIWFLPPFLASPFLAYHGEETACQVRTEVFRPSPQDRWRLWRSSSYC